MIFAVSAAQAQTVQRLIESCRDRVGRPIVEDCLAARGKTADFDACREEASPQVRGCLQDRMADTPARLSRQVAIAHCRQSVGRGIVDACMQKRGVSADLGSCRRKAVSNVRACVRSGMIASFGRARVRSRHSVLPHHGGSTSRQELYAWWDGNGQSPIMPREGLADGQGLRPKETVSSRQGKASYDGVAFDPSRLRSLTHRRCACGLWHNSPFPPHANTTQTQPHRQRRSRSGDAMGHGCCPTSNPWRTMQSRACATDVSAITCLFARGNEHLARIGRRELETIFGVYRIFL